METNSPDVGKKSVKNARATGTFKKKSYFLCPRVPNKTLILHIPINANYLVRFSMGQKGNGGQHQMSRPITDETDALWEVPQYTLC